MSGLHWVPFYSTGINIVEILLNNVGNKASFIGMQLRSTMLKNVMLLFVREAYFVLSLHLCESFLLRNSVFLLDINQLLQNTDEIMILLNYIKFNNQLLIEPLNFSEVGITIYPLVKNASPFQKWVVNNYSITFFLILIYM